MQALDLATEIYSGLSANKVRSFLTVLGIVIGIASVITMVAIGQGAQNNIQASIESAGANLLYITPGAARGVGITVSAGRGSAQTLTPDDATALSSISGVGAVEPEVSGRYQLKAPGHNTNTSVVGTVANYLSVHNIQIGSGAFFSDQDVSSDNRVAVLGPTVVTDLFPDGSDPVGQKITINGMIFQIIGVTVSKGGTGFNNPDTQVYVPITVEQHYLTGNPNSVSQITVQAADQSQMTAVQNDITALLLSRHNIADPTQADFSVINQSDIVATASSVTSTFTTLLAAVAGISLLVGGIGIMNMMLTTVTERTREIGLRQAIGAEKHEISQQFLLEAVALTFIGGAAGIVIGWLASIIVSHFAGLPAAISLSAIMLAFGVSAGIGIVFGYYPARRAANLNPIDALRFE